MREIEQEFPSNLIPEPAKPILASHLLDLEKKQRLRFIEKGGERISTGCPEIDEILDGGIERGIVLGISADDVEGKLVGTSCFILLETTMEEYHFPETKWSRL